MRQARPEMKRSGRKRERTCGELVAAAERLVAVHGLDAISIDDITEAAHVAKGTFYTHFEDKDDLAAVIGTRIRFELEDRVTRVNEGVTDTAQRMANGLSTALAFAIANPVRARALLRLRPSAVDPDASINAGIRSDIALGLKANRFWAASLTAAVVATIGTAMSAMLRVTGSRHGLTDPHAFAADVIATALVALGLKPNEATRLAAAAMTARKKEPVP